MELGFVTSRTSALRDEYTLINPSFGVVSAISRMYSQGWSGKNTGKLPLRTVLFYKTISARRHQLGVSRA